MKICPYCKKGFDEGWNKKQKYCSRACRNRSVTRAGFKQPHKYTLTCVVCDKEFKAPYPNGKYCSVRCRQKYHYTQRYKRNPDWERSRATSIWRKQRKIVLGKQDGKCWLCDKPIDGIFEVHHLLGPSDDLPTSEDVAAFHRGCHNRIHNLSLCTDGKTFWVEGRVLDELKAQRRINMKKKYTISGEG